MHAEQPASTVLQAYKHDVLMHGHCHGHVDVPSGRFPMRQLKLLLPLYQAARHVELDGVAGEPLHAERGIIPGCAFATTVLSCCCWERSGR